MSFHLFFTSSLCVPFGIATSFGSTIFQSIGPEDSLTTHKPHLFAIFLGDGHHLVGRVLEWFHVVSWLK